MNPYTTKKYTENVLNKRKYINKMQLNVILLIFYLRSKAGEFSTKEM